MNLAIVRYIISRVLRFEAVFLLLPGIVGLLYGEVKSLWAYILTAILCLGLSFAVSRKKPVPFELYAREGFVSVALSWIVMSIFGAIPFVLTQDIPNYIDALFESVSGLSTTGASILNNVESLSKAGLFWRSFSQWLGGMGVFVFIMAILPLMGGSSITLMRAESPGPSVGKLLPRVRDTAKILYEIYIGLTILVIILLCILGLSLFESVTIAFGTIGTGGFGIRNDNFAGYDSVIQVVVAISMILSGINYGFYFCLLRRQFKEAFSIEEVRWYLGCILAAVAAISLNIYHIYQSAFDSLRHAFFQVASIITTAGFSSADYDTWPQLSKTILLVLMFIGACAGSTGGGLKVSRIVILCKTIHKELTLLIHPRLVKRIRHDGKTLSNDVLQSTNVFFAVYFVILFLSVLLISLDNFSFTTNFSAVVASLNNIGLGFDLAGPTQNYALYSSFSKLVLMFDMLAGRLELFPMLILLTPSCWKKY